MNGFLWLPTLLHSLRHGDAGHGLFDIFFFIRR